MGFSEHCRWWRSSFLSLSRFLSCVRMCETCTIYELTESEWKRACAVAAERQPNAQHRRELKAHAQFQPPFIPWDAADADAVDAAADADATAGYSRNSLPARHQDAELTRRECVKARRCSRGMFVVEETKIQGDVLKQKTHGCSSVAHWSIHPAPSESPLI